MRRLGSRAKGLLRDPARAQAVFAAALVVAFLEALSVDRFAPGGRAVLEALTGVAVVAMAVLALGSSRLQRWMLHASLLVAIAVIGTAQTVGGGYVDFAELFIWVATYSALFFTPSATVGYVILSGGVDAVSLTVCDVQHPMLAWFEIVGTGMFVAMVVSALVGDLARSARTDPLLGIPNRRWFDDQLVRELARARRSGNPISVGMLDVDGLKVVNDLQGHDSGDKLLRSLTDAWDRCSRGGADLLARVGGDEFAVLAPGTDASGVELLMARLGEATSGEVTFSWGAATWNGTEDAADLVRRADLAMYRAKASLDCVESQFATAAGLVGAERCGRS
ncbi:MAG: GGDEF domain-containing protein [Actinomycetota bacterium]|nr:GGDEF domain-containing protein [Actinomycetota bacterium]